MTTQTPGPSLLPALLLSSLVLLAAAPSAPPPSPDVPPSWRFTFPAGEPAAGEAVFVRMKCGACHKVEGRDEGSAARQPEGIGPTLTGVMAQLPPEYLAERLMTTDRFLPHGLFRATYSRSDGSSRMGNYNEEMTVKDLIDLVSYLRSIGTP